MEGLPRPAGAIVADGGYEGAPTDGRPWLDGGDRRPRRCLRGGARDVDAFRCRSAWRSHDGKHVVTSLFGLRLVIEAEPAWRMRLALHSPVRPHGHVHDSDKVHGHGEPTEIVACCVQTDSGADPGVRNERV